MKLALCVLIVIVLLHDGAASRTSRTINECSAAGLFRDILFPSFSNFIRRFRKVYHPTECMTRFLLFKQFLQKSALYQMYDVGTARYGTTFFADMTPEEARHYLCYKDPGFRLHNTTKVMYTALPSSWDWRQKGVVSPVSNQGSCGSCYAFAMASHLESVYAVKYNKLYKLSQQQIVDCSKGNLGCDGGYFEATGRYLQQVGLMAYDNYPYVGKKLNCRQNPRKVIARARSHHSLPKNEDQIAQYLYKNGPVTVGVNAEGPIMAYKGGVIDVKCSTSMNHAVLLVGFGIANSPRGDRKPYWIVKNSWGSNWGERGYFRIARNKGLCGINLNAYAVSV